MSILIYVPPAIWHGSGSEQRWSISTTFRLIGLKLGVDIHGPLRMSSTDYLVVYGQWPKPSYTENIPISLGYTFFLAFSSYWCANIKTIMLNMNSTFSQHYCEHAAHNAEAYSLTELLASLQTLVLVSSDKIWFLFITLFLQHRPSRFLGRPSPENIHMSLISTMHENGLIWQ